MARGIPDARCAQDHIPRLRPDIANVLVEIDPRRRQRGSDLHDTQPGDQYMTVGQLRALYVVK